MLHVEAGAFAGAAEGAAATGRSGPHLDDGTPVTAVTARRLACDAGRVVVRHGTDGSVLDVGRRTRTVPPALRRALEVRDRGCRFPGCGLRFTDAHHIVHWADGGETRLYLSGANAGAAAALFTRGPLVARELGEEVGQASALKMCYAAYTKGTTALLCAILAAAENLGVRQALEAQWTADWPDFTAQSHRRVRNVTAKAWRFHGEMGEIASTFAAAGLPPGFHEAAQEIYARLAHFKDDPATPELLEVLQAAALS